MNKIIFRLTILISLLVVVVGCGKGEKDPYLEFRGKTSAQIFDDAERALAKGNYSKAAKNFEALDAVYPFGPNSEQAQLDIIYAYYMNGDEPSALAAADRYIRLYPRGQNVDYVYYMRGVVGFSEGLSWLQKIVKVDPAPRDISTMQESFTSFAEVVRFFPDSQYALDSQRHMIYIRNMLARREVLIADYYLRRTAYLAAANRASFVVEHFSGSPEIAPALAISVKAYRALGLDQLAEWSYRLLATNFPDSPEFLQLSKYEKAQ